MCGWIGASLADLEPLGGRGDEGAGFGGDAPAQVAAEGLGQGHAPVEADAGPVEPVASLLRHPVEMPEGRGGRGPRVHADVRMVHDRAVRLAARLVLGLRGDAMLLAEAGAAGRQAPRDLATFGNEGTGVGQVDG